MIAKQTPYNMRDGMEFEVVPDVKTKVSLIVDAIIFAAFYAAAVYILIGYFTS